MIADELIATSVVCDMVWPIRPQYDNTYESLGRFRKSGFDLVSVTLAGDQHNISQAVQMVADHRRQVLAQPDDFVLFETLSDLERARSEEKLCLMFHFEGSRVYERNLDMIEMFFRLGVRFNLLAFNNQNSAGGGAMDSCDPGLTPYGRRVVQEMERVGMLLDLSHTGRRTTMDAMELCTKPPIFSHHGADTVFGHPRNLTDEQMRTCAALGGVIGVSGGNMYLGNNDCSADNVFRHLDYMVELVGVEHVGLGFDIILNGPALDAFFRSRPDEWPFAQDANWPGAKTVIPEQLPDLVEVMKTAGYSDANIRSILGGNFCRVFSDHWA